LSGHKKNEKKDITMHKILESSFYLRDSLIVAKELLGKTLVRKENGKTALFKIVETEAYRAPEDKASHAYGNRRTARTETMFAEGGCAYIYLIYGMYYCLNIVSEQQNIPHAVLIRGIEPLDEASIDFCKERRKIKSPKIKNLTNGPGKLCQALGIDKTFNGHDLRYESELYVTEGETPGHIIETTRINIDYAEEFKDKLWRFYIADNPFVSVK
jgi:DNA-3-methyladenine glycosylase